MSHDSKTSFNHSESPPLFDEPIPADLPQRRMDRKLLESIDEDRRRSREHSNRLTRLESLFEQIEKNIGKLEQSQREGLGWQEQTATAMAAIANKLAVHTEMEEYQWTMVNESRNHLAELSAALNSHLESAGSITTRIDWIERLLFVIYGAVGTLFGNWLLSKIG